MDLKKKNFDCVAKSRHWREAASARLNAMSAEQELAHLRALGESIRSQMHKAKSTAAELLLREDAPEYGKNP